MMSDSWEKMANDAVDALAKAEAKVAELEGERDNAVERVKEQQRDINARGLQHKELQAQLDRDRDEDPEHQAIVRILGEVREALGCDDMAHPAKEVERLKSQIDRANDRIEIMHTLRNRMSEQLDRANTDADYGRQLARTCFGGELELVAAHGLKDWVDNPEQLDRATEPRADDEEGTVYLIDTLAGALRVDATSYGLTELVQAAAEKLEEQRKTATKPRPMSEAPRDVAVWYVTNATWDSAHDCWRHASVAGWLPTSSGGEDSNG